MMRYVKHLAAVVVLGTIAGLVYWFWPVRDASTGALPSSFQRRVEAEAAKLLEERQRLDQTTWANEIQAQQYEETFVRLWDELRSNPDQFAALGEFQFDELLIGHPKATERHLLGVELTPFAAPGQSHSRELFVGLLAKLRGQGFELVQSEWHHKKFEPGTNGPARSTVGMVLYAARRNQQERWIIRGDLRIEWSQNRGPARNFLPRVIDATDLEMLRWQGPPVFVEVPTGKDGGGYSMPEGPLLVYDLNQDGLPEIILPAQNALLWNRGQGRYEENRLCAEPGFDVSVPVERPTAAVVSDLNGDGWPDLAWAGGQGTVVLFEGDREGRFRRPGKVILKELGRIIAPSVIATGDINGDGLLDLWLAQYKVAYEMGQMPTPYYDANDGFRAYLLVNQGQSRFVDATESAGLGQKRYRRTYSASFVDLDDDADLDLLVVSDLSGIDLYRNDGRGNFTDITAVAVDERANFGMGHVFGDFNEDGRLDFFVTGMSSTTARRLEQLRLGRRDFPEHQKMRMPMAYGNRLYLGQADHTYRQSACSNQVARSGWSWGTVALDLANDSHRNLYVCNGHISGKTTKDYCTRFWTQDIYSGGSRPNPGFLRVMQEEFQKTRDWSWNGYEKNALFLNEAGTNFLNVGFLMDLGFEFDSRNAVADDIDADGRMDVILVELNSSVRGDKKAVLHVLRNQWPAENHWIGIRLSEEPGRSAIGARVTIQSQAGRRVAPMVTGDSYKSQHPLTSHFGLGRVDRVDAIEVRWPDGKVKRLANPAINQYHRIKAAD